MCDTPETNELLKEIRDSLLHLRKESKPPIDLDYLIDDNHPWIVDYHERKHIFLWLPAGLSLSVQDYGSSAAPTQSWINLGFREGTILSTIGQATLTVIKLRFTDESVP